jgi:hypothetical protein
MPFPLAHPAAVIPLRRFCPRFLSFPALLAGSVAPDFGYLFYGSGADNLSHSLLGSLVFDLPAGLLGVGLFYWMRGIAARRAPILHQRIVVPVCDPSRVGALAVVFSVLVGTWTHLLLDSIAHKDGWIAQHLGWLQIPIGTVDGHAVRVCHLLWYCFSFIGMAWFFLAFRGWQQTSGLGPARTWSKRLLEACLVASLLIPIEIVHHLVRGNFGLVLVGLLSLGWVGAVGLRVSSVQPQMGPDAHG